MEKVMFAGDVCLTEIKPKFPPKVQQIWDDCGTHVTSLESEQGAKEIEFFVEKLIESIVISYWTNDWRKSLPDILKEGGYLK